MECNGVGRGQRMEESKNKCGERIEKRRGERKDRTGQDRTG